MAVIDNIALEPLGVFGHSSLELANDQAVAQAFAHSHHELLNVAPQAAPFASAPSVVQLRASQLLRTVAMITTYRMRAYDTTLAMPVYWNSASIDAGGVDYNGPGPLTGVVVVNILFS